MSALLGKKWAMRAFGADALEVLENTPWKGLLMWCVKRSVLLGMETLPWSKTFREVTDRLILNVRMNSGERWSKRRTKSACLHCPCQAIKGHF